MEFKDMEAQKSGPPPSYEESVFKKIQTAKDQSDGNIDFGKKFCFILCGSIGCTIAMGVFLAIPIAMIVMGAIHLNDCPAERMIPIYLIVGGSFGILKNLLSIGQRCKNRDEEDSDEKNTKPNPVDGIVGCFLLAWFIAGNVWVYRTHNEWSKDSSADNYCDPTLYWFAFWIVTSTYIILGVVLCLVCCGVLVCCCCAAKGAAQGNNFDQQ
ncbi:transmembrane protein 272-like isoform X2 [Ruditapes philippinarum]|uniref:transmembrane protein 272-like isoform X2 n=1 Tax=Ruditapes philippinarum TaxID=129788 RepID=UPI00295B7AD9|nr:transmembrane protein 272-like isoform X2 [Ruditapes philippinarum]